MEQHRSNSNRQPVWGYGVSEVPFSTGNPRSPLGYMDFKVTTALLRTYSKVPPILWSVCSGFRDTLLRSVGGQSDVFQSALSYQLRPSWAKAGRDGMPVGPRFPIAQILDPHRYGPSASSTAVPPDRAAAPKSVLSPGAVASFSVQVSGSEPSFQWQRSNDEAPLGPSSRKRLPRS